MEVRLATDADAGSVTAILSAAFEPLRHRYTEAAYDATVVSPEEVVERLGEGPIWIAFLGATPVGTVSLKEEGSSAYIRGMGVAPSARSHGVGTGLMQAVDGYLAQQQFERVWLMTTTFLHPAIRLYRRHGFEEVEGRPDFHGTPVITMERRS